MATGGQEFILEDLEKESILSCAVCGVVLMDAKAKKEHLKGRNHQKKLKDLKQREGKMEAKNKLKNEDSDSDSEEEIHCPVCRVHFTDTVIYLSHLHGNRHKTKKEEMKLRKEQENMPGVLKEDQSDSEEDIFEKKYAECTTCKKDFYCAKSFKMHTMSMKHKRNIKAEGKQPKDKKCEDEACEDKDINRTCDVCKKSFSGTIPFQIHLQSKVHEKFLEKKKSAETYKEFYDEALEAYICHECQKPFSDPVAFQHHLNHNSHEQQKAKRVLNDFLKENPEIVFAAPDPKFPSADGSDSEESDQLYFLICKVCSVTFSGPECAKDHAKSKKHISRVKDKKARKVFKLKSEVSSVSSDKEATRIISLDKKEASGSRNGHRNSAEEFELL